MSSYWPKIHMRLVGDRTHLLACSLPFWGEGAAGSPTEWLISLDPPHTHTTPVTPHAICSMRASARGVVVSSKATLAQTQTKMGNTNRSWPSRCFTLLLFSAPGLDMLHPKVLQAESTKRYRWSSPLTQHHGGWTMAQALLRDPSAELTTRAESMSCDS